MPACRSLKMVVLVVMTVMLSWRPGNAATTADWGGLNLPEEHVPYFFHNNPNVREKCSKDHTCPYKDAVEKSKKQCWGYEEDCPEAPRLPECRGDSRQWAADKESQRRMFWDTADFGYVRQRGKELKFYCKPNKTGDSSLECVDHLRYCRATNFYLDLSTAKLLAASNPYREDVLSAGQIGGRCELDSTALKAQLDHKSPLQSWAAELEHFVSVPEKPLSKKMCDVVISKPTYFIKLDATVNMYHHFCDYVNLYVSQHFNNSFSTDANVLIWDTSGHLMSTMFAETWRAFTDRTPLRLKDFDGKKVCFKKVVFSFLARMRQGLYYNMPLVPGCHGSTLMKAFSHHIVHRLKLPQYGPLQNKIRVTLLSRSTKYRQIMNQEKLVRALQKDSEFEVRKVDFVRTVPFLEQVEISHNSDIFIGMHGAGLTHMLFQPDWAVIMELYNCEDSDCYHDLARLRGIRYMTWENKDKLIQEDEGHHPTLGAHAKFTNYAFDVEEFMRLVRKAAQYVRSHPAFIAARNSKFPSQSPSKTEMNTSKPDAKSAKKQQEPQAQNKQHHPHTDL
ncbi:EGF domain-specific O-linked N-acetylglucosamine transferase-like [Littorina saxatilis]|uniref:EGF domain-specific O-linked N-acetylglucosamine transferase n=1 Tax=Littorina saxatilis TaxID=31220 RepID=A0AAN9GBX1_9CAEN